MGNVAVYALDITALEPDRPDWSAWVEPARLAAARRYRLRQDRARCIGAGLLLTYAVALQGVERFVLPPRTILGPRGKPRLADRPDIHVSLSHAGRWAVCALGSHPIGVDIEAVASVQPDIARGAFSHPEQQRLESLSPEERPAERCAVWVLKESYLKATGEGLCNDLREITITTGPDATVQRNGCRITARLALIPFPDTTYRLGIAMLPST